MSNNNTYTPENIELLTKTLSLYTQKLDTILVEYDENCQRIFSLKNGLILLLLLVIAVFSIMLLFILASVSLIYILALVSIFVILISIFQFFLQIFRNKVNKKISLKKEIETVVTKQESLIRTLSQIVEHLETNFAKNINLNFKLNEAETTYYLAKSTQIK